MHRTLLALMLMCPAFAFSAELAIPILTVAGKKKSDVSAAIGKATACETVKQGEKCYYQKANTAIIYINGKADWISVEALDQVQDATQVLLALGLKTVPPNSKSGNAVRWLNLHGLLEITAFQADHRVDYALIKVSTP